MSETRTGLSGAVLDLFDPRCRDAAVAGGKAAGLCRARSVGLPVLPGVVVPAGEATEALAAGAKALGERGSGGARRAAMTVAVRPALSEQLRVAVTALGGDVVVRSSADVEASGEWSGAFSTFSEIGPDDAATAVRGCWASAFGVDALDRAEHTGRPPESLALAVLLQPRVVPEVAGLARLADGAVTVEAVAGSPAALMDGHADGHRVVVAPDGTVGGSGHAVLDEARAREVAALVRRVHDRLGHGVVEWAWTGGGLVLLQSMPAPETAPPPPAPVTRLAELDTRAADRVAALALAFPGGACDELVFPWLLGARTVPAIPPAAASHAVDLDGLRRLAGELAARVWATSASEAVTRSSDLLRALRGDAPGAALATLDELAVPDADGGSELLALMLAVGERLAADGRLRRASDVFGCDAADLARAAGTAGHQSWAGARRWEPFLAAVTQTRGTTVGGIGAAAGIGAGRARVAGGAVPSGRGAREVVVATAPTPSLSPLLWDAAALVTVTGSAAAHVIEVARSLGVPAVVASQDLPPLPDLDGALLAVDGDTGTVSYHRPTP
ncbi:MAG: hypothetical protein GEV10_16805 [Streptosporangiales bacterium]|nr:hypothetical protein [Streptosporangiales bacterium]